MEFEQLKLTLSEMLGSDPLTTNLIFLFKDKTESFSKQATMSTNTQDELTSIFKKYILENILFNEGFSLLPLSKADERKLVIYQYDLEDLPKELKEVQKIYKSNSFTSFDHEKDNLSKLKGIGVYISSTTKNLLLYRQHYPVQYMNNVSNFSLKRLRNENTFEKLEEDLIKINTSLDFFFYDDECYILNLPVVEKYFGLHETIIATAKSGITKIKDTNLLENTKPLEDRISDVSFARKLIRAERNSPVLGSIPNEEIIEFTKQHPIFKGSFDYSADDKKIVLSTRKSSDKFLLMLNDDLLRSELTKKRYAIRAKDEIKED